MIHHVEFLHEDENNAASPADLLSLRRFSQGRHKFALPDRAVQVDENASIWEGKFV